MWARVCSYALGVAIGDLESVVAELQAAVARLTETLADRESRIVELERLLEESRRSGKRQAAPFRKGDPVAEPKTPGRKRGGCMAVTPIDSHHRIRTARLMRCCRRVVRIVVAVSPTSVTPISSKPISQRSHRQRRRGSGCRSGDAHHVGGGCRAAIVSRPPTRWVPQERRSVRTPKRGRHGCITARDPQATA